jgi:hypothetical protein
MPHSSQRVSPIVQIPCIAHENYAKVIARLPATVGGAPEELLDHGEI